LTGWASSKADTANEVAERGNPSITISVAGPTGYPWPRSLASGRATEGWAATSVFVSYQARRGRLRRSEGRTTALV
jgi:hypothetical protein